MGSVRRAQRINDYTSLDQFACDISLNSAEIENNTDIIEPEEEETDEPAESNKKINLPFRKGSSGLSKGGLAAIIISVISVITIYWCSLYQTKV